jgi:hypothetical protein
MLAWKGSFDRLEVSRSRWLQDRLCVHVVWRRAALFVAVGSYGKSVPEGWVADIGHCSFVELVVLFLTGVLSLLTNTISPTGGERSGRRVRE